MKEQITEQLKKLLASTFCLYLKAHQFHWNVEGPNFNDAHAFLSDVYTEYYESIDDIAEQIRQLGAFAPGALSRYSELTVVPDEVNILSWLQMVNMLKRDNAKLIELATEIAAMASQSDIMGLENYLQDRIMALSKLNWKYTAITS